MIQGLGFRVYEVGLSEPTSSLSNMGASINEGWGGGAPVTDLQCILL